MDENDYWNFIESDSRYPLFNWDDIAYDDSDYHYPVSEE